MPPLSALLFDVPLTVCVLAHVSQLHVLLPSLHGSLLTTVFTHCLPLVLLPVLRRLSQARSPPPFLSVLAVLLLPALHHALFPLLSFLLLLYSLAVPPPHIPLSISLLSVLYPIFLPLPLSPDHPLPSILLSALLCTKLLVTTSQTFKRILTSLTSRSRRRSRRRPDTSSSKHVSSITTHIIPSVLLFCSLFLFLHMSRAPLATRLQSVVPRRMPEAYKLVWQRRGPTGLISVVEKRDSHRMLLADYSVLGGYFINPSYEPDSIFAQFYVHEAVRLSRRSDPVSDSEAGGRDGRALCLGVGVGVVAHALSTLGSRVDAVELDDRVAEAAKQWFGLRHPVLVRDGREFVRDAGNASYDFVVHDAFTGGGISPTLVSIAELQELRRVLKVDGVMAINVVTRRNGLGRAVARIVYERLRKVFGHARMFSDGMRDELDNVVMFASATGSAVRFRTAVERDFVGSSMRKSMLEAFQSHEIVEEDVSKVFGKGWGQHWMQEMELRVGLMAVAWTHSQAMPEVHGKGLWPAVAAGKPKI